MNTQPRVNEESAEPDVSSRLFWPLVGAICIIATFLRFYNLGSQGLWIDELHTWEISKRSPLEIWLTTYVDPHPPLYNLSVSMLRKFWGSTEASMRLLSAVCGATVVPAFGWYLNIRHRRLVAMFGMWLVAVSPVQVFFSQEARAYAMSMLWTVISLFVVRRLEENPRLLDWLVYILLAVFGVYTNYFLGTLIVAQLVVLTARRPAILQQSRFYLTCATILLACLPLVPSLLAERASSITFNQTDSGNQAISVQSSLATIAVGDSRYVPRFVRWGVAIAVVMMSMLGIVRLRHKGLLYVGLILIPGLTVFIVMPLFGRTPPSYQEKQFIVLAPAIWTLVAVGWKSLWNSHTKLLRGIAMLLIASWIVAVSWSLQQYYAVFTKSYEHVMVEWILSHNARRLPILLIGNTAMGGAFQYYSPDTPFFFHGTEDFSSGYSETIWVSERQHTMFRLAPPVEVCELPYLGANQDLWLVADSLREDALELVEEVTATDKIRAETQIGRYIVYTVAGVSDGQMLRCEVVR